MMRLPITPEIVRLAYRLFLDRDPEDDTVVEEKANGCNDTKALRSSFVNSEEFKLKNSIAPTLSGHEPPIEVEYSVSEDELRRIFNHIQMSWSSLGKDDPYFSVLTSAKFWKKLMSKERIDEFYESGKSEIDRLFKTLERNSIDHHILGKCLDYGCGAGRISRWLSEEFETVYGYDVSENYLAMAQKYLNKQNITNVEFFQIANIEDFEKFPKIDLIYSVIVLQHNPPPIIHRILVQFMKALNPGGVAFFQVPTYQNEYQFRLEEYLGDGTSQEEMEMHVLPQSSIFEIVRNGNGKILEVVEDFNTSWGLSNTFLVQKI